MVILDEVRPNSGRLHCACLVRLKARLLEAFDIQVLWNKPGRQATVHAEITDATLRALPAILNPGQDGYDDTDDVSAGEAESMEDLFEAPIVPTIHPQARIHPARATIIALVSEIDVREGPMELV